MTKSDSSKTSKTRSVLKGIRSPVDIKALSEVDLLQLAQEVRETLIDVLSKTGGHLGPNLGVVELTIALHRVFETPKDRFVFDVSHQGYVHKMFTGRLDRIHTMRQYQGLNGFLLRTRKRARLLRRRTRRAPLFPPASAWRSAAICGARMKTSSWSRAMPPSPAGSVTKP